MWANWLAFNPTWKFMVNNMRESPALFAGFNVLLLGSLWVAGSYVMYSTNPNLADDGTKNKDEELAKLPMDQQVLARANRTRLRELILDIQAGKDSERYSAALRGDVLGANPVAHEGVSRGAKSRE